MIGTKIFVINCVALFITLFVCSLIGRLFTVCCPNRLKPFFNLFLSPVMGMSFLILMACLFGRFFPFSNTVFGYSFVITLVVISFLTDPNKKKLIQYAVMVGLFGLICGLPLLLELFFYGGYNAHNDAYTYLAISDWLQSHAFNQTISIQSITPAETQPAMYQAKGFRMGGSYFMGFLQAIFHIKWSYTIYPSAVLVPAVVCCLAMGFPIFLSTIRLKRWILFALLVLPALSFGALSFGMLYGFMSQTFGLATGSAALFWYGAMLPYLRTTTISWKKQIIYAVPLAFFLSACIVSYAEISVFIVLAIFLATIFFAIKSRVFVPYIVHGTVIALLSVLLINSELSRVIMSLMSQSQAVVGSPIDWPWFGYFFHMIGLHGGGWDIFQWSMLASTKLNVIVTIMLLVSFAIIFLRNRKRIKVSLLQSTWLPSAVVLCIFILGIIYFRYFFENPFPVGRGQSWSQFKLSEWAFPFAFAFFLTNIILLCRGSSRILKCVVVFLLLLACYSVQSSVKYRMEAITGYYGEKNLDQFYQDARQLIVDTCPKDVPIYLNLINENHKFRQMLSLYLNDRRIKSNWIGDGYIVNTLPESKKVETLQLGDCLVQSTANGASIKGATLDIMNVSIVDGSEPVQLVPITETYGQEHDQQGNTWYWVESSIKFKPIVLLKEKKFTHTELKFQYMTRISENLFIRLKAKDGHVIKFKIDCDDSKGEYSTFKEILNLPASEIAELDIHANGIATPLGLNDSRNASWMIRNLTMVPER